MKDKLIAATTWIKDERRIIWLEYSGLALVILLPLLLPGYILTLDLVFTPHFSWPTEISNTYPFDILLWLLHFILPGDVIEKLILFSILLLSGVGMHKLVRSINIGDKLAPETWRIALYFAGIFYMINPFTYSRFMAGQWMVLLGYALLPFFVRALLQLVALPGKKSAFRLVLWTVAIISISIHHIGMIALLGILVPVLASFLGYWHDSAHIKRFLGWAGVSVLVAIILSSYWLVPAVLGKGDTAGAIAGFNQAHFAAFETTGNGLSEVIRLQGFWGDDRQLYRLPQTLTPAWGVIFLLIWVVVIMGAIKAWRHYRMVAGIALGSIVLGVILSATPLIMWLSQFIPLLAGYREPHKFVNLIVLGYCLLGTFGVAYVFEWAARRFGELSGQVVIIICLLLPLAVTPTMLWGFAGQLSPRSYPEGWYQMGQTFRDLPQGKRILFLPWHQYSSYGFSGRIIANPAEKFFDEAPVVASNEPEFRNITPTTPNEEKSAITTALKQPKTLLDTLRAHKFTHILLAKENDKVDYGYLDKLPGIRLVSENTNLKLYQLEQP